MLVTFVFESNHIDLYRLCWRVDQTIVVVRVCFVGTLSLKAKSADFRNLSPDEQVRQLQQRAAELQRREDVKYSNAQHQLHSEIVGPVKWISGVFADGADYLRRCGDTWS